MKAPASHQRPATSGQPPAVFFGPSLALAASLLVLLVLQHSSAGGAEAAPPLDRYGGWTGLKGDATGFFNVQKLAGRSWLITPEGHAFFSLGVYCVRISGIPDSRTGRRLYQENCLFTYGTEDQWARVALKRVGDWAFNTIGDWSSASVLTRRQSPYCLSTGISSLGKSVLGVSWARFPDVFDPAFAERSRERARELVRLFPGQVNDPWLLGYFIDDEAGFYGSQGAWGALVQDYAKLPADAPGKQAFVQFLQDRYRTIGELNAAWHSQYGSFEDLRGATQLTGTIPDKDKSEFLSLLSARFVAPICEELKRLDPNHLILGPRPSRYYSEIMSGIGRYCDVINVSAYGLNRGPSVDPAFEEIVNGIARDSGRPVMLGANITARSREYPKGQVRTQRERGLSYQRYLKSVCSNPNVVGLHWFQYFDPPPANKEDTGNWGLVTEGDQPYEDCVSLVAEANRNLYQWLMPSAFGGRAAPVAADATEPPDAASEEALPSASPASAGEAAGRPLPVANADFEASSEAPWRFETWRGNGRALRSETGPHGGKRCVEFHGSAAGWDSNIAAVQSNPPLELKLDHRYRLSVWLRSEGLDTWSGIRLKVKRIDGSEGYIEAGIKQDEPKWTQAATEFDDGDEQVRSILYLAVMHIGKGKAWADDVELADLGAAAQEPRPVEWPAGIALPNPGMEELDAQGRPAGWQLQTWHGDGRAELEERETHSGKRAIRLRGGSQSGWGSTVAAVQSTPPISFQAGRRYLYSAWVRTQGLQTELYLRIKVKYPDGKDGYVEGILGADLPQWSELSKEFALPREARVEYIGAVLVGQGLAWIDDVSLKEKPQP